MDQGFAISLFSGTVLQILIVAAPVLVIGMAVGLIIAIFQATTSLQEQTLSFVPKILAIFLALVLLGRGWSSRCTVFTLRLFEQIPNMGR